MNGLPPLPPFQRCELTQHEVALHGLSLRSGLSSLKIYADSYFFCGEGKMNSSLKRWTFTVMRVPKEDLGILGQGISKLLPRDLRDLVKEERLFVPYKKYEMSYEELVMELGFNTSTGRFDRPFHIDSYFHTKGLGGGRFEVVRVPKADIQLYEGRVAYLTQMQWELLLIGSYHRSRRREYNGYLFEHEVLLPTHSSGKQFKVIMHKNSFTDCRLDRCPLLTKEELDEWQIDEKGFSPRPEFRKCLFRVKCHETSEGKFYLLEVYQRPLQIEEGSATFLNTEELLNLRLISIESGEACNGPGIFKSSSHNEKRTFKVVELPPRHPSYETYELTICKELATVI